MWLQKIAISLLPLSPSGISLMVINLIELISDLDSIECQTLNGMDRYRMLRVLMWKKEYMVYLAECKFFLGK